jgi:hypothetical protein
MEAAAAGVTTMPLCVPPMLFAVSVAVIEPEPAVFKVALNVCTPLSAATKV